MHPALQRVDHRPWPVPATGWTWRQQWKDLLFAHYPVPVSQLRPLVPPELTIQEFGGTSWVGVVPFRMTGVMRRPLPDIPGVSAFPELNVRLYVEYEGKPGVWFLSLDAANLLAVVAARALFHLPYYHAKMDFHSNYRFPSGPDGFGFASSRTGSGPKAPFEAHYRPTSEVFEAQPGTLEAFLVERYCLYAKSTKRGYFGGKLFRGEIHHAPWPLQKAEGSVSPNPLLETHGLSVGDQAPLLHFSSGVDVVVWSIERVG